MVAEILTFDLQPYFALRFDQDICTRSWLFHKYAISSVYSQGHNLYKLKYVSLEEVEIMPFQQ